MKFKKQVSLRSEENCLDKSGIIIWYNHARDSLQLAETNNEKIPADADGHHSHPEEQERMR